MNTILTYLDIHWRDLHLDHLGSPGRLSCLMATPRFKTSSHVLFFVLAEGRSGPVLVAKVPRLAGDNSQLDREVRNLCQVQATRLGGYKSIPKVLVYEDYGGHRLLIETAVEGQPLKADFVRQNPDEAIRPVMDWIIDLHTASAKTNHLSPRWFNRVAEVPMAQIASTLNNSEETALIEKMRSLVEPLSFAEFPLVFQHGDFSSPNILIDANNQIGVVDWELAEPEGLPALDMFFFLNFVAFARHDAKNNSEYLQAFQEAFFGEDAWARPYLMQYCEGIGLNPEMLRPIFLLCWGYFVANLIIRLKDGVNSTVALTDDTITWLRQNRYYLLWEYALTHIEDFKIGEPAPIVE